MRLFLILTFILSSFVLYAQTTPKKKQSTLREKLYGDMQIFDRVFKDDADFLQLEQEMRKLMQEQLRGAFSDEEMEQLLNPHSFGNAFEERDEAPRADSQMEWSETEKARVLKIKIKMPKDQALDLKIEKNQIKISGEMKTAQGTSRFSRILSVPADCDGTLAQISADKEGNTLVTLPKRFPTKIQKEKEFEKKPVGPSENGVAI